ncbi:aspartoacylase [filamentous cyanobacterium LEGE 11480]|uniref:Probable aspartoacylase n=1 Tax=Romeriopsis navalis LEGE 11480 TaxID=2777977 RepID=A0A928VKL1_9CYAN|nr:aspartoacylase [Romeriopsis navalis]MBE9028255.1 aspartoacylase [Romeriopsis navalis LEGE 11480]
MRKFDRILIVGGTHGNELTGAYLIRSGAFEHLTQFSFEVLTLLANPRAVAANLRYLGRDLNRSFERQRLDNDRFNNYEDQQAREIYQRFGPHSATPVDVIIDLHTTTANMGNTIILDEESSTGLQLAANLSIAEPSVKIYSTSTSGRQDALRTIAPLGICIEVGPVVPGILDAAAFAQTQALVLQVLADLDRANQGGLADLPESVTLYRYFSTIDYPRNQAGQPIAMIHPQLQLQNYQPLYPGDPIFIDFAGHVTAYMGPETVYPIFINEAAYYEKGIAFVLTQKQQVDCYDQ